VKIPRRLNAALDRVAAHSRAVMVVVPLVVAAVVVLWMPTLAALAVGVAIGAVVVHLRMSRKVARLRAEADDLLRENGALRHQKTVIARKKETSPSVLTQKLPSIAEYEE
jgi:hypothetical protein